MYSIIRNTMEKYKQLNTELIGKLQELKLRNAECEKQIINLQAQLMDKHALYVEQKQKFVNFLKEHMSSFHKVLGEVDPYAVEASSLAQASVEVGTMTDSNPGKCQSQRRSSSMYDELRRSIALRRSQDKLSISPSRKSSPRGLITIDQKPQTIELQQEESESQPKSEEREVEKMYEEEVDTEENNRPRQNGLDSISESDCETATSEEEIEQEDTEKQSSTQSVDFNSHSGESIFSNNENENISTTESIKVANSSRAMRLNTSDTLKDMSNGQVTRQVLVKVQRAFVTCRRRQTTRDQSTDVDYSTIVESRNALATCDEVENSLKRLSLRPSNCNDSGASTSKISLGNFMELPSSTPRKTSVHDTVIAEPLSNCESSITITPSNLSMRRPSRSCKPTNLKEPQLNTKLRAERPAKKKSSDKK